ncbi:MAG TPA: hypothetical protein VGF24_28770 [Vicinamibacterales bacterium]|jgi:hypothetical protein
MGRLVQLAAAVGALACLMFASSVAASYPMTLTARANFTGTETTISSTLTITVERLMDPDDRTFVLDGLKYRGYQGFMDALRPRPVIGQVGNKSGHVDLRYAWETKTDDRRRLVLVADKPFFFIARDTSKPRGGFELTVIDLQLDDRNTGSGTMAPAARVKRAPDGGPILDDFATAPVQLTVEAAKQ